MAKSQVKIKLKEVFASAFMEERMQFTNGRLMVGDTVVDGIVSDAMSDVHKFINPKHGVVQRGYDLCHVVTDYISRAMQTSAPGVYALCVDTPKYVPCAKRPTQRSRDRGRQNDEPFVFKRGDSIVTWNGEVPTSDQMFSDRRLKYEMIHQVFSRFAAIACTPVLGQTLYVSGTRFGCIRYEPAKQPMQVDELPKVGEAELRWVSMLLNSQFPNGTWVVHSKDTDNICIAVLHSNTLLKHNEIFIDCISNIINLRILVRNIKEYYMRIGSKWDAFQLILAMQIAGNDFQTGVSNCAHNSFWDACMNHSVFIKRVVDSKFTDVNEKVTCNRHAMKRLVQCALYRRYKLARTLPPVDKCSWDSVSSAVLAKTGSKPGVVPSQKEFGHMCDRADWNLAYWWHGAWGPSGVPDPLRSGWRKRSSGLIETM